MEKPERDPRHEFKTATFKEGVENIKDLEQAMILEGVVTNVTDFGAFIDISVHQDALVHISAMSDKFIKNSRVVVKTGDLVKVKVMDVDSARKRISLSMQLDDRPGTDNRPTNQKKAGAKTRTQPQTKPKQKSLCPKAAWRISLPWQWQKNDLK